MKINQRRVRKIVDKSIKVMQRPGGILSKERQDLIERVEQLYPQVSKQIPAATH